MFFLKKFSGLTDGQTTEKGDPFYREIRLAYRFLRSCDRSWTLRRCAPKDRTTLPSWSGCRNCGRNKSLF
jgi:hypothetical protein